MRKCQGKILRSLGQIWTLQNYQKKLIAAPITLTAISVLFQWSLHSNSCALNAFFCIIAFDVITLVGDLGTKLYIHGGKPPLNFSFGYVRVEVLSQFSVLSIGILLNFWAVKKCLELVLTPTASDQEIHTGRFIPMVIVGGVIHGFMSFQNNPFVKVFKISSTTTTSQRYFQGICASFGLSLSSSSLCSLFLNPFVIQGSFAAVTLFLLAFALQTGPRWLDLVGGGLIIGLFFDTLWRLWVYTGQILLQTLPAHLVVQLEKSLREASTVDGVLEFRNELFWTLTHGNVAGTLHVRVRRDGDEQLVLSKLHDKLHPLASHITLQITKDDFTRPFGNFQISRDVDVRLGLNPSNSRQGEISPIPHTMNMNHVVNTVPSRKDDATKVYRGRDNLLDGSLSSLHPFQQASSFYNNSAISEQESSSPKLFHYPASVAGSSSSSSKVYRVNESVLEGIDPTSSSDDQGITILPQPLSSNAPKHPG